MYTFADTNQLSSPTLYRISAAAMGIALASIWIALVLFEAGYEQAVPNYGAFQQALLIAAVFAGYGLGWRRPLLGGTVTILGFFGYLITVRLTVETFPGLAAICFAVPGILYLAAWICDYRQPNRQQQA
jgi:hypothetical protein